MHSPQTAEAFDERIGGGENRFYLVDGCYTVYNEMQRLYRARNGKNENQSF
jgi:hypothetical protein